MGFFENKSFLSQFTKEISCQNATGNQRNQGLLDEGAQERRQERENQEEHGLHQIQGSMLQVPLHPRHQGQGEGREAQTIFASRSPSQGIEVNTLKFPVGYENTLGKKLK